jgi:hypothetical protein
MRRLNGSDMLPLLALRVLAAPSTVHRTIVDRLVPVTTGEYVKYATSLGSGCERAHSFTGMF